MRMDLEDLLSKINAAAEDRERVTLDDILDEIGRRSFGPFLLVTGLVMVAPVVGDIPGVPVLMGLIVLLIALQLLIRDGDHFWLPQWLLRCSVSCKKIRKGISWMKRPARFVDSVLRPRLKFFTHKASSYAIAVCCIVIALATPVMEFVPFSANFAGLAVLAFGLALMAEDGLFALAAFIITAGLFGFCAKVLI